MGYYHKRLGVWLEREPAPGYYKARLKERGPFFPVLVFWEYGDRDEGTGELMSDDLLRAVAGENIEIDPYDKGPWLKPISGAEYRAMMNAGREAQNYDAPAAASQNPKIDLTKIDPIF